MRRRKNHNTSGVPNDRADPKDEKNIPKSKRPEGSVNEHRQRMSRNHEAKDEIGTDSSSRKK